MTKKTAATPTEALTAEEDFHECQRVLAHLNERLFDGDPDVSTAEVMRATRALDEARERLEVERQVAANRQEAERIQQAQAIAATINDRAMVAEYDQAHAEFAQALEAFLATAHRTYAARRELRRELVRLGFSHESLGAHPRRATAGVSVTNEYIVAGDAKIPNPSPIGALKMLVQAAERGEWRRMERAGLDRQRRATVAMRQRKAAEDAAAAELAEQRRIKPAAA